MVSIPVRTGRSRHEDMGLAREDLLRMYRLILLSHALNERMWILQRAGVASFIVTTEGHKGLLRLAQPTPLTLLRTTWCPTTGTSVWC